jgi:thiamine transporter
MEKTNKQRIMLICAVVILCVGLIGSLYTLIAISASERAFQAADQEFRALREHLRETDPDAVDALVRPVREYAAPLTSEAIVMLSVLGVSILLFFVGGGLLITRFSNEQKLERISQSKTSLLTISALCIALAVVLSQVRLFQMPQGGSVTALSMLPIVLVGYWYGTKAGMTAGLAYGILRLAIGVTVFHPVQFILDYPLAYAALGAFGLFRGKRFGLQVSYLAGATGRFVCSFIAGIVFFGQFAPEGQHVWVYSALYQLAYLAPEIVVTMVVISMPPVMTAIENLRLMRMKGTA